jgi:hypothetical protein
MGFREALLELNEIKRTGLIQDYAIGGAYAFNLYGVPQGTFDLDVFLIVSPGHEAGALSGSSVFLSELFAYFKKRGASIEHDYVLIGDLPVQFLPNLGPLHDEAVREAQIVEYEWLSARFVDLEHLVLLLLTSFREKDKLRIKELLDKADRGKIDKLLERFDDAKTTLSERFKRILA